MGENPTEATKTCASCGADVTAAPRVKDAKGRYFCRECAAKMQAALAKKVGGTAAAAPVPAGGDADIMSKLVDDSIAKGAVSCPACRRPWKEGAIVCTGCGFNKQTGQVVGTQIKQPELLKDPKAPKAKRGGGGKKFAGSHWKVAAVVLLVYIGGGVAVNFSPELGPIYSGALSIYALAFWIFSMLDIYMTRESILYALAVPVTCGLYALYHGCAVTENDLLKGTAWAYLILILFNIALTAIVGAAVLSGAASGGAVPGG